MKKSAFLVLLLLLIVRLWFWLDHDRRAEQVVAGSSLGETNQANSSSARIQKNLPIAAPTSEPTPESNPAAWIEKRRKQMEEARQEGLNEWRTPIEFYGKVVDENTNPVEGAQINFDCNDISATGTSFYHAQSDANGLFSIKDIQGKLLGVKVSKAGYYSYLPYGDNFEYGDKYNHFTPDVANPVIFRLKKKGQTEPLVHLQAPMGGARGYKIARDGAPVEISLTTGATVSAGQGDLRVECWTDDQGKPPGQKYDWKCRISVPDGGVLQSTEDLDFQAPPDGYQPAYQIDMPASLENEWANSAKRNFFLKLADGNYARMSFEMVAGGDHFFKLESYLNPSGSRNLEPAN